MLKLPAVRGDLQIIVIKHPSLTNLCEAYEDACVTLERLRATSGDTHCPIVKEYETICAEIEAEITEYCLTHQPIPPG